MSLPEGRRDVFLSYASEDEEVAETVNYALSGRGYSVFFDKTTLPFAGDYHSKLREAVNNAKVFVFLISPDSLAQRKYARTELKYARFRWEHPKGSVLPVMVRPVALSAVPSYLKAVTLLEPEGNIAAEVADAVSDLLPTSAAPVPRSKAKRATAREPRDPSPFLRYLDREFSILLGLVAASLLLALAATLVHRYYPGVWEGATFLVLVGAAMAVAAAACFYGQLSHLSWIIGRIQLARVRVDSSNEHLNEQLLAVDSRHTWARYRLGLASIAASAAAYGLAIVISVLPSLYEVIWHVFLWALGLTFLSMAVHYYVSTHFPHADAPLREWFEQWS
jgi:hypothetical protein